MRTVPSGWKSRLRFSQRMIALLCGFLLQVATAQSAHPATAKTAVQIRGYSIDVSLDPAHHSLTAKTRVEFTVTQNLATVEFQFNPALHVDSVTDGSGKTLSATQKDGEVSVTPATPLPPGSEVAWTFSYSGVLGATSVGVPRLALIGEPVSYLLYRANWFPVVGDGSQRFTAEMHVHVPVGVQVLGSGLSGSAHTDADGDTVFDFNWTRPGFPGTVIAGKFQPPVDSIRLPHSRVSNRARIGCKEPCDRTISAGDCRYRRKAIR